MTRESSRQVVSFSLVLIVSLVFSIPAFAGKGGSPSGKPFVEVEQEIDGQIESVILYVDGEVATLQDQADAIIGRVDNVEDRALALEASVADLLAQNATFAGLIATNSADISSLQNEIDDLIVANEDLQDQIDAGFDPDGLLQDQIDLNEGLITGLQQSVQALLQEDGNLQGQIDNNLGLIQTMQTDLSVMAAALEAELATKQIVIHQNCPAGEAINAVLDDGSVNCIPVDDGGGSGSGLLLYSNSSYGQMLVGQGGPTPSAQAISATCPEGSIPVAAGYSAYYMSVYQVLINANSRRVTVFFLNPEPYPQYASVRAICLNRTVVPPLP